jgi:hypothetical protein
MAGDLRFLKGYAYGATSLVIVLSIVAFRQSRTAKFDTIDVQRINIVEADGRLRMTLSGHDNCPIQSSAGNRIRYVAATAVAVRASSSSTMKATRMAA